MSKSPTWAQGRRLEQELCLDRETAELLLRHPIEFAVFKQHLIEGTFMRVAVETTRYPNDNDLLRGFYALCGHEFSDFGWSHATSGGKIGYLRGIERCKFVSILQKMGFFVEGSRLAQEVDDEVPNVLHTISEVRVCEAESGSRHTLRNLVGVPTPFEREGLHKNVGALIGLDAALAMMVTHQERLPKDKVLVVAVASNASDVWCIDWCSQYGPTLTLQHGDTFQAGATLKCIGRRMVPSS